MRCIHHDGVRCTNPKGVELFGPRPSEGVCVHKCPFRDIGGPLPEVPSLGVVRKALNWAKAEVSRVIDGPVQGPRLEQRLDACRSCQALSKEGIKEGQLGWCTKCGCGRNARAELTIKATMPSATCPLGRWITDTTGR